MRYRATGGIPPSVAAGYWKVAVEDIETGDKVPTGVLAVNERDALRLSHVIARQWNRPPRPWCIWCERLRQFLRDLRRR